jgi:hypothetical protein
MAGSEFCLARRQKGEARDMQHGGRMSGAWWQPNEPLGNQKKNKTMLGHRVIGERG